MEQQVKKSNGGCFVLVIGVILGGIFMFKVSVLLGILVVVAALIASNIMMNANEKKEREIVNQRLRKTKILGEQEKKEKERIFIADKNALEAKYGIITNLIPIKEYGVDEAIIVFEQTNQIIINGIPMPMQDIISCTFSDDPRVIKGKVTYETKTQSGSMVKRAIVGNVLFGGTGAVIGGSTANKTTTAIAENDKVCHNYTVIINVNNLARPVIKLNLGEDGAKVNEIVGLMNAIASRRK